MSTLPLRPRLAVVPGVPRDGVCVSYTIHTQYNTATTNRTVSVARTKQPASCCGRSHTNTHPPTHTETQLASDFRLILSRPGPLAVRPGKFPRPSDLPTNKPVSGQTGSRNQQRDPPARRRLSESWASANHAMVGSKRPVVASHGAAARCGGAGRTPVAKHTVFTQELCTVFIRLRRPTSRAAPCLLANSFTQTHARTTAPTHARTHAPLRCCRHPSDCGCR